MADFLWGQPTSAPWAFSRERAVSNQGWAPPQAPPLRSRFLLTCQKPQRGQEQYSQPHDGRRAGTVSTLAPSSLGIGGKPLTSYKVTPPPAPDSGTGAQPPVLLISFFVIRRTIGSGFPRGRLLGQSQRDHVSRGEFWGADSGEPMPPEHHSALNKWLQDLHCQGPLQSQPTNPKAGSWCCYVAQALGTGTRLPQQPQPSTMALQGHTRASSQPKHVRCL